MAKFLEELCGQQSVMFALKILLVRVRRLQRVVRAYFVKQETKRILVGDQLRRAEVKMLKRQWAESDLDIISRETKRLRKIRSATERKGCERAIEIAKQSHRRYMRPKSAEDYEYVKFMLNRHCVPVWLLTACARHAESTRRMLVNRILDERLRKRRAYIDDSVVWDDVDQALRLMNGSNAAERPRQPVFPRLPFLIEPLLLQRIISRLRQWHSEHSDEVRSCVGVSRIPCEIDDQVRALVTEAMSPAFFNVEEAAHSREVGHLNTMHE